MISRKNLKKQLNMALDRHDKKDSDYNLGLISGLGDLMDWYGRPDVADLIGLDNLHTTVKYKVYMWEYMLGRLVAYHIYLYDLRVSRTGSLKKDLENGK